MACLQNALEGAHTALLVAQGSSFITVFLCRTLLYTCCLSFPGLHAQALRELTQAPANSCPFGCAPDACVPDDTSGGYICIRCVNSLVLSKADGTCGCPAGRFAKGIDDCQDCTKGSYCPGGRMTLTTQPPLISCGPGLTTIGLRSTSVRMCGELVPFAP